LRVSELAALRWDDVDFAHGRLHVNRAKNGLASVHPLPAEEIPALRRVRAKPGKSRYIFVTERNGPMTKAGFLKMLARTDESSGLTFTVHPGGWSTSLVSCGLTQSGNAVASAHCLPNSARHL